MSTCKFLFSKKVFAILHISMKYRYLRVRGEKCVCGQIMDLLFDIFLPCTHSMCFTLTQKLSLIKKKALKFILENKQN